MDGSSKSPSLHHGLSISTSDIHSATIGIDEEYDYPWVPDSELSKNKSFLTRRVKLDGRSNSPLPHHGPLISASEIQTTTSVHSYININIQGNNAHMEKCPIKRN